ncbi:ABC transporter substrate binding protein [Ancylomarina sp. 16SWW S1-10-2]|uniref:sensor histidine kinase n=1 Tax=Ancylomarina sp. 16SWW S1-10-2 TaxID=2499681 RepID=UPI0012AE60B0|nr:ABC transporter substrate binding protein [Ancylomarina sp. 16SWW S1-10-2]MRT94293.1 hypothetical protein [Ancylomarina sp. 16SWW S1-10-2]
MSRKYIRFFASIFLICLCSSLIAQNIKSPKEKNILILHSYHQGLEWTDNISEGILSVFQDRNDINLFFEYLDTKRNYSQEYFDALKEIYKNKTKQNPYTVIITCDNAAFDFMQKYSDEYYNGVPVIFCGVNNLDKTILNEVPHFYGYDETVDYKSTLNAIKTIFPNKKNVLIVNDHTLTGKTIRKELEKILPQFENDLNFEFMSEFSIDELKKKVKSLDDTYAIYLLVVNRDKDDNFISYKNGIRAINKVSKVPIFGSWDFYENKGLLGGKITRGFNQGKYAALMAEKIIENGISDSISQYNSGVNSYVFDYNEMEKFGVSSNRLPEGSLIINKPKGNESLFKIILLIFSLVLLITVIVLVIRLRIKRRREQALQNLVNEKTHLLTEMNLSLKHIISQKDRFLSIISHDLRGPFNYLVGFSTMLNNEFDTLDKATQKDFINTIHQGIDRTYKLLEDLLSWSYSQSGAIKFKPEEINAGEIVKEIIEVMNFSLEQKNIKLINNVKESVFVSADKNMLSTIIRNLFSNAIKFTPKEGVIVLDAQEIIGDNKKSFIEFSVKDTGVGISKENQSMLFDIAKVSSNNGTDDEPGTGLGLILCKEFTDKHKGEIWVESEPEKGSRFVFTMPAFEAEF